MEMYQIEKLAHDYASAHKQLQLVALSMNDQLDQVRREHAKKLLAGVRKIMATKQQLQAGLEASPQLFKKPKTTVFYGVRVGYKKGKGATVIPDQQKTIDAIKNKFPDKVDALIQSSEKLLKNALSLLSAKELKKIGVETKDAGEHIVIQAESEADKIIDALIAEYGNA